MKVNIKHIFLNYCLYLLCSISIL